MTAEAKKSRPLSSRRRAILAAVRSIGSLRLAILEGAELSEIDRIMEEDRKRKTKQVTSEAAFSARWALHDLDELTDLCCPECGAEVKPTNQGGRETGTKGAVFGSAPEPPSFKKFVCTACSKEWNEVVEKKR